MLYRIHCLCTWGGVGKLLLVVHCSLLGWKVTPSMHFYTVHICIYNYIAMFWTRILLYLLVSVSYKSWSITGDFYFFFSRKKMLVIFVSLSSWSSPLVAHTGIRNGFLEELRSEAVFAWELPNCWLYRGGGGEGEAHSSFAFKACFVPWQNSYTYNYSLCILSNSAWIFFF